MSPEIKKLVPKVVGEALEGAVDGNAGEFQDIASDETLVQGRVIMDYADSGTGKSTRAHSFARYYYIKTGLPVLLVGAEDSSKVVFQDLIDAGIVHPVWVTSSKITISVYERIVEGEVPLPGHYEEVKKTVKKDGKEVVEVSKRMKWLTKEEANGRYGAVIFEGLSTISENILDYLRETGRFPREQSDGFAEGGRTHMAASQTAYGFTQAEGIKLVKNSGMLPVARVLWTAHEAKGKDEFDGSLVRGPKLVGSAATNVIRKHVGVLLHTEKTDTGEIRTYFEDHPDAQSPKVTWKAKVTVNPFFARELKKKYPKGYFLPSLPVGEDYAAERDGLIEFLEHEEQVRQKGSTGASKLVASLKQTAALSAPNTQGESNGIA